MAKADILSILYSKNKSALEFRFDMLTAPPLLSLVSIADIDELYRIATSVSLASKIKQKYKMIDDIMVMRGFKKLHAGTNRVIYRHLEIPTIVAKIAIDEVGISDNPDEFANQVYLQPYVTKVFEVSPNGVIGLFERVQAISSREEFVHIAPDIFDFINTKLIGEYVVDDIGTKFFMNWGIRDGFGPVLLDFPYVYKLDGNKIFCNHHTYGKTDFCGGVIDYDLGFNHLVCEKCGKHYQAKMLKKDTEDIIINKSKGDIVDMKIKVVRGRDVITEVNNDAMDYIAKPKVKVPKGNSFINVRVELPEVNEEIRKAFDKEEVDTDNTEKVTVKAKVVNPEPVVQDIKVQDVGFARVVYGDYDGDPLQSKDVNSDKSEELEQVEVKEVAEEHVKIEKENIEVDVKVTIKETPEPEVEQEQLTLPQIDNMDAEGLAKKLNTAFNGTDEEEKDDYAALLAEKFNIKEEEFEETEDDEEEYVEFEPSVKMYKTDVESQY